MSSRKKAESYKLYSCTHLSRAKINIRVDKSHIENQKFVKYMSKPNPSLTINSVGGPTTVFLPPPRSLLKSNEFQNVPNPVMQYADSFEYEGLRVDVPRIEMNQSPVFPFESSEFDDFEFSSEAHPSRYKPNILKTKSAKVQISALKNPKTNNKDLIKEKSSRKRKQTYNLPNIDEDDVILHETKRMKLKIEENNSQNEEKCKKKGQKKPKQGKRLQNIKKKEKEDSCARVCPYTSEQFDKPLISQKNILPSLITTDEVSFESLMDFENYEDKSGETASEIEDRQAISAESLDKIEVFKETFPEYQIGNEFFEEASTKSEFEGLSIPINSEFFVPDYLDYLNTSDSISDSDEVHKLISPTLSIDAFDMYTFPSLDDEPTYDINGNDLKPISGLGDLDEDCKNFISENRFKDYTKSSRFQDNLEVKESNSIRSTNVEQAPAYIPHFGIRDALINGCDPIDIFSDIKDNLGYQSDLLGTDPDSDERKVRNPQVIVELNKFFLSCAHVECYDEKGTAEYCDLHQYVNDQVPVSPKTLMPVVEAKKEEVIIHYVEKEPQIPKKNAVEMKLNKKELIFER